MENIIFTTDTGEEVAFYVLSDARLGGVNYILVTDAPEGDGEALILKDVSEDSKTESSYVIVEDDNELEAVARLFAEDLDDIELS